MPICPSDLDASLVGVTAPVVKLDVSRWRRVSPRMLASTLVTKRDPPGQVATEKSEPWLRLTWSGIMTNRDKDK